MPALDRSQARDLLLQVVNRYYAERHSPLTGAFVKAQMLSEAQQAGAVFSERELGVTRFIEFVRTVPEIAIQDRPGSDILLAPVEATQILAAYASPLPRLRRDFWRAFIEFPVQNTVRLYDAAEDKILREDVGTQRQGIVIEPITRETQLQWRRTFSEEQSVPMRDELLAALEGTGNTPFNEFARRMREDPSVMRAWNRYLQKQITDHVAQWASLQGIPEDRWLASPRGLPLSGAIPEEVSPKPQNISQRAELYNFFDQLPIDELLQLRVPLEWVLKVTRRGDL